MKVALDASAFTRGRVRSTLLTCVWLVAACGSPAVPEDDAMVPLDAVISSDAWIRPATCGNGVLDAGERCDGVALGDATCASVLTPMSTGTLRCEDSCLAFDTTACVCMPRQTCEPLACGEVDDGCGGRFDCAGMCPDGLECGDDGRCARSCVGIVCPGGTSCEDGFCAGALDDLVIDVPTAVLRVRVSPRGSGRLRVMRSSSRSPDVEKVRRSRSAVPRGQRSSLSRTATTESTSGERGVPRRSIRAKSKLRGPPRLSCRLSGIKCPASSASME